MANAGLPPPTAAFGHALTAYRAAQFVEAERICRQILAADPGFFDALHLLAAVQMAQGNPDLALASLDRALALRPDHAGALAHRGATLEVLKRLDEAVASYDRALSARPDNAQLFADRGLALYRSRRFDEALSSFDRALALHRDHADALVNRGNALQALNRHDEALTSYDRALTARPGDPDALNNRGFVLRELKRPDEALASYDRALAARPRFAEALNNRGNVLLELRRFDEALASYDRALALRPDDPDALNNRGNVLQELNRLDEALASYDRALAAGNAHAFGAAADCAAKLCDWDRRTRYAAELPAHIVGGDAAVLPFMFLGYCGDPALQRRCAENYIGRRVPAPPAPLWIGPARHHDKIRVAYLSADFRLHAMASLMSGLIDAHDRSAFEIFGISFGIDDGSAMRRRLIAAFDRFDDVRGMTDAATAKLLFECEIDIAIDLMGYTKDARPGILAHRPAPVQASYLGYPGTTGAHFIDYIIADKVVAPFEHRQFFTEHIVHLPDCYQANDDKRPTGGTTPTRQEAGLPEQGFVFCCFNNNWKIAPAMFDIWMRLLRQVEGSVLWLLRDNDGAQRNLRQEAARRGVDPSRLVFAARLPADTHLARHQLADLFLDTLPSNAHTTASDALWMGLPVLTTMGETFAARVAASLLHAIGLPDLIAPDRAGYEALALKLARDPALLAAVKATLARNRATHPLFDTARFTRHIEAAYRTMWDIAQRGQPPRSFAVPPSD